MSAEYRWRKSVPPVFPLRVLYCFQPRAIGHQPSRLFFILLVVILWLVRLDVKWLLIRHYIESKNPREDQYSINHSFGVGLSGHWVNERMHQRRDQQQLHHPGRGQSAPWFYPFAFTAKWPISRPVIAAVLSAFSFNRLVSRNAWNPLLLVIIPDKTNYLTVAFNADFVFGQFNCSHNFLVH